MRAGRTLRRALLAGLLAASTGCTHRDAPQVMTHLSDTGAETVAAADIPQDASPDAPSDTPPWRLRLTRL